MSSNRRILIIDDHRAIHEDFRKILAPPPLVSAEFDALEAELFSEPPSSQSGDSENFELASAFQGQEGVALAQAAEDAGAPFAVAYVDVRMPPGWDGIETIGRLWQISPRLYAVICTAYSDYSREQIDEKLGRSDRLLVLRKPFDPIEILRIARDLTTRWSAGG